MNDTKTSPTKVNQYASAHVNQEHVCFVGTTTTNKYELLIDAYAERERKTWSLRHA